MGHVAWEDESAHHAPTTVEKHSSLKSSDAVLSEQQQGGTISGLINQVSARVGSFGKIIVFTINVLLGLVCSQLLAALLPEKVYKVWYEVVRIATMWCLSYIMINVGYEFVIDKSNMRQYAGDYLIAMTAAGFPWIFVAIWYMTALPNPLDWDEALLAARFAAPTSAGVLFCMLEAAGLKETWLFKKARILAIFDDLDTILLMIPLKAIIIGVKWELFVVLAVLVALVALAYVKLHAWPIWKKWYWTLVYAGAITAVCELIYYGTKKHIEMEAVHLEVLLPAFVVGAITSEGGHEDGPIAEGHAEHHDHAAEDEKINTAISAIFMVLVGLSMPSLFNTDDEDSGDSMGIHEYVLHVAAVSLLMVLGKMFPVVCYQDEANFRTRFALALGMCPRGEVGAGVIVISLALGIKGDAVPISIISLALNIAMSGGFIFAVTQLLSDKQGSSGSLRFALSRRFTHLWPAPPREISITEVQEISDAERRTHFDKVVPIPALSSCIQGA